MILSTKLILPLLLVAVLFWQQPESFAVSPETQAKIEKIKVERLRLAKVRKQLEVRLGSIGGELRKLDSALIKARKARRAARDKVRKADRNLIKLKEDRSFLKKRIVELKKIMLDEVVAAWKRSSRSSEWMGVFTGVPVSDIPHRRFMLNVVMHSQEKDQIEFAQSIKDLAQVEIDLKKQRKQLERLRIEKKKVEFALAGRVDQKRNLLKRVRKNVAAKKSQDRHLAQEEKALLRLIDDMTESLLAIDQQNATKKIRQRKGHLEWPLRGKIIANYGSKPTPSMPRLQGIQLKPLSSNRAVKSMGAGQVRYADWFGGYGLMTIVDYGEGVLGVYAHNDTLYKQLGDWVDEGETISEAGSTGLVNKVALYFEIRDRGKTVNPKGWCRR